MPKQSFYSVALFTGFFSLLLFLFPQIDLTISNLFYQPERGFLLAYAYDQLHLDTFRNALVYTTYTLIAVIIVMLIAGLLFKNVNLLLSPRICLFLLISFSVAPVLVVNGILKNHWGRARPFQVQQFGGDKIFTPAWVLSSQCKKNCSFTSGETANVFCYVALLFIVHRKKLLLSVILGVGALTSFERIAQGNHFFSDAILSGLIDYLIVWIIHNIIVTKQVRPERLSYENRQLLPEAQRKNG